MDRGRDVVVRYVDWLIRHHRRVAVALLITTIVLGAGVFFLDGGVEIGEFDIDSPEAEAQRYVDENFQLDEREFTLVAVRGENVLTREALLAGLTFQDAVRSDPTIRATLHDDPPTVGLGNAVAATTDPVEWLGDDTPTIAEKQQILTDLSDEEFSLMRSTAIAGHQFGPVTQADAAVLVPTDHDHASGEASARLILVVHDADVDSADRIEAQQRIETLANDHFDDVVVFGPELAFERAAQATADSFVLVGPLFVLIVIGFLSLFYRTVTDVVLAVAGIGVVLLWTVGFIGWTGLAVSQLLAAVPFLLIGLSIDYWIHLVMRVRAERTRTTDMHAAFRAGAPGVIAAIVATTATTAIGFLSGVVSPFGLIRTFGITAAFGILAAGVVFGAFIPALRLWIAGSDRTAGTRTPRQMGSTVSSVLERFAHLARAAPTVVILVALVVMTGGLIGATGIDTSTDRADFMPTDQQSWMGLAPAIAQPDDRDLQSDVRFLDETFDDITIPTVDILIQGSVTDPQTLETLETVRLEGLNLRITARDGITTPLDVLEEIAEDHQSFAETLEAADTTGDGIPDTDLEAVFDEAFRVDADRASSAIHRTADGSYDGLLFRVVLEPDVDPSTAASRMDRLSTSIEADAPVSAIATGGIIQDTRERGLVFQTAIQLFGMAVLIIGALLTVGYRYRHASWTLGGITLAPVVMSLGWLVGIMYLVGLPYNAETVIITGIAIGLGVDYAIHVTERFASAYRSGMSQTDALSVAVTETGGAVFASALTTAAAFVVLRLTVIPSLQRFGIITALAVSLAFIATIVVLPALLVLWSDTVGRR